MRQPAIDIMKAIGIFLVIIGHHSSGIFNNYIYSFHMPMFFIIAGYLWHEKDILVSLKQDVVRIMIPYFAYFAICIGVGYIYAGISISRMMQDIMMISWGSCHKIAICGHHIQGVGVLWFLPALFVCKNVFNAIWIYWKRLLGDKACLPKYICILVLMIIGGFVHRFFFPLPFALTTGLNALGFFAIGQLMRFWLKDISLLDHIAWFYKWLILIVWLSLGCFVRNGMASCEYYHFPLNYVTGICGTISCYYFACWLKNIRYINVALQIIGQYTMSILIIHQLVETYAWIIKIDYTNHSLFIVLTTVLALVYVFGHYLIQQMIGEKEKK